ncbi:MAG: hypothetical protein LBT76_03075 [Tannerella sp.]|nr:hypothetical protein [Tannerella sp.]
MAKTQQVFFPVASRTGCERAAERFSTGLPSLPGWTAVFFAVAPVRVNGGRATPFKQ